MKFFTFLVCFLFLPVSFFPCSTFSMEEEVVFELKRESKKSKTKTKRKKTLPSKFKRQSFSYSKDFLIFNEQSASTLKKGTALRVNIPYPVIASFTEEFPVYGIVTYPFKAVLSGKIKAIKNTNKASVAFDEIIVNDEQTAIKSFPVFINGNLKESLFKDIALNFFESLPSILALALRTQIPQTGIQFIKYRLKKQNGKTFCLGGREKTEPSILGASKYKTTKACHKIRRKDERATKNRKLKKSVYEILP